MPGPVHVEVPSITRPIARERVDERVERRRRELLEWLLTAAGDQVDPTVLRIQAALERLRIIRPLAARVLEYRYFGGVGIKTIAQCVQSTQDECMRELRFGRAWLLKSLRADSR